MNFNFLPGAIDGRSPGAAFAWPAVKASLPPALFTFFEAARTGAEDAMLGSFATGAVIDDSGRRFIGHDEIREWIAREFEGESGKILLRRTCDQTDAIVVNATWTSSFYKGEARLVFQLEAQKIARMRFYGV